MKAMNKSLVVAALAAVTMVSGTYVSQAKDSWPIQHQNHRHDNDRYENHHKYDKNHKDRGHYSHELSREQAINIALKRVPGATMRDVYEVEKDQQDDRPVWEGEIHKNGREYEFTVDAISGRIVEWDEDSDD